MSGYGLLAPTSARDAADPALAPTLGEAAMSFSSRNRPTRVAVAALFLSAALLAGCSGQGEPSAEGSEGATAEISIGYPVTTLINGQVGQVMINTDVLALHGLEGEVVPFTSGPPANEAMAAGDIDVQLTSEGPAVQSALNGVGSTVVGTLGTTRDAILARPETGITTVSDLRGRTVGVPFGTTPYLHMVQAIEAAGLDAASDVSLVNMPANELAGAFTAGHVDAVAYNEPLPTQLEESEGGATVVSSDDLLYVVIARTEYLEENPEAVARFMAAIAQSLSYLSENKVEVNEWFSEVSRTPTDVIDAASSRSPFYVEGTPADELDLSLAPALVERLQGDVDFFAQLGDKPTIPMDEHVDVGVWTRAEELLEDVRDVTVTAAE